MKEMWLSIYMQDGTLCGDTIMAKDYDDAEAQMMKKYGTNFGGIADYGFYMEDEEWAEWEKYYKEVGVM